MAVRRNSISVDWSTPAFSSSEINSSGDKFARPAYSSIDAFKTCSGTRMPSFFASPCLRRSSINCSRASDDGFPGNFKTSRKRCLCCSSKLVMTLSLTRMAAENNPPDDAGVPTDKHSATPRAVSVFKEVLNIIYVLNRVNARFVLPLLTPLRAIVSPIFLCGRCVPVLFKRCHR